MAQIKKDTSLRKAILQAAIMGKLKVENGKLKIDETGKQLLERIIEERNKKLLAEWEEALKKNPKAKKPAPIVVSEIDEDEIPFEIPENWCWCRLGDVCYKIGDIDHRMPKETIDGIPYISPKDFTETDINFLNAKKISREDFDDLSKKMKPQKGDIIFPRYGTIGTVRLVNVDFNFLVSYSCCTISTMRNFISEFFVFYALQSKHIKDEIEKYINKTTQPNVGLESIKQFLFPLPPLSVQNAIVAKLEQVLPLVDAYENAVLQKEELKSTLSDKVKKAILQEAITGKLTEEWRSRNKFGMTDNSHADADNCHAELVSASQESGEQLLARIIKERNAKALAEWEEKVKTTPKAKKPVPVVASEIEEDEIPFEIPESWCWCRLGDVIDLLSGRDLEPNTYNSVSKGIPYMTGASNFENEELIVNRWTDKPVTISSLGDLLITCKGTIGELAFNHVGDVHIARQIMAIRKTDYINLKFLKFFLMSRVDEIQKQAKSMIPGISREDMLGFYFPLPPLEEQKEIVKKVEELLTLCK